MDDFYCTSTTGQREEISSSDLMRTKLYYPVIDRMLSEMTARFSPQNAGVFLGINACNPSAETFMRVEDMKKLSNHYNFELFEPEVLVAKNFISTLQLNEEKKFTMQKVYGLLNEQAFPTLKKVFQVTLTIPVTSCSCERA